MSPVTQRPRELMMSRWMSRNWFEITVMKVGRNVAEGEYPRLVSGRGGTPSQYPSWDECEDEA